MGGCRSGGPPPALRLPSRLGTLERASAEDARWEAILIRAWDSRRLYTRSSEPNSPEPSPVPARTHGVARTTRSNPGSEGSPRHLAMAELAPERFVGCRRSARGLPCEGGINRARAGNWPSTERAQGVGPRANRPLGRFLEESEGRANRNNQGERTRATRGTRTPISIPAATACEDAVRRRVGENLKSAGGGPSLRSWGRTLPLRRPQPMVEWGPWPRVRLWHMPLSPTTIVALCGRTAGLSSTTHAGKLCGSAPLRPDSDASGSSLPRTVCAPWFFQEQAGFRLGSRTSPSQTRTERWRMPLASWNPTCRVRFEPFGCRSTFAEQGSKCVFGAGC